MLRLTMGGASACFPAPDRLSCSPVRDGDREVVAGQLGRTPRDLSRIAARCPFGYPAVIETLPISSESAPNPTLLYLVCPALVLAVSRAEASGAVRAFKSWVRADAEVRRVLADATRLYQARREVLAGEKSGNARLEAGIGGPVNPENASCLHAYAATFLAFMSGWPADEVEGAAEKAEAEKAEAEQGEAERSAQANAARQMWNHFFPPPEKMWCEDQRCAGWALDEREAPPRAVIDVGTISVRLLVAQLRDGEMHQLVRRVEVTRLGEGLRSGGELTEAARARTAAAVARYVKEARESGAQRILLAGTSAAREAVDGGDYICSLGVENDVAAAVLSGEEEAELAYVGATLDVAGDVVVVDVGGGSTELICRSREGALDLVSLGLGASRATEHRLRSDPPAPAEIVTVYEEAAREVGSLAARFGAAVSGSSEETLRLVGVAGTVTTLACLDAGLEAYDDGSLHLRTIPVANMRALLTRLSAMTVEERALLPCVQRGRAPVIVAGAVIVLAIMETLGFSDILVSVRDLLDGLWLHDQRSVQLGGALDPRANV